MVGEVFAGTKTFLASTAISFLSSYIVDHLDSVATGHICFLVRIRRLLLWLMPWGSAMCGARVGVWNST
jgi:hypothetical protein